MRLDAGTNVRHNVHYDRDGYFVLGSFLFPDRVGSGSLEGQVQPMLRFQEFSNSGASGTGEHTRLDLGVNHIINGHNARISLTYSMDDPVTGSDFDMIKIGLQFQI